MKSPLNDQTLWTENMASPASVQSFNQQLAKLFGVEQSSGRQWIRLLWAASDERDEFGWLDACDWNCYGDGGRGQWRRRYLYSADVSYLRTLNPATGLWEAREIWKDVSPPRFVIERFVPPQEACAGWRASGFDSDGDRWTDIKPIHGRYEALMLPHPLPQHLPLIGSGMIADHPNHCCAAAKAEGSLCYGQYAEPGARHLEEFRMLAYMLAAAKERRPGAMTSAELDAARKRSEQRSIATWAGMEDRLKQIALEALRTHRPMFSEDESVRLNGKYHWMSGHNKSGTPKIITEGIA